MKKSLLIALGTLLALPTFAQDDVTSLIQNAGFDTDLTFQTDGKMKEAIITDHSLSERSWAYIAADSTVYAKPKSTSSQQRKDGRSKLDATNGFIGRVEGWTIETNQEFPNCEWVYFGTIPYDLGQDAIPIADDGDTYLLTPERPAAASGEDNVAFAYLRAGWGGRAVYKQVVKLPCAQYRLEYWAININPNGKNGKNLSKVVCRKDTWEDETGFNDQEWTLHTIDFTPTSEFSMQFGFESSGGSGSNPFLCIDGIKLYRVGDADPIELLTADVNDLRDECTTLANKAASEGFEGLGGQIDDYQFVLDELLDLETQEEMEAALAVANAKLAQFREALEAMSAFDAMLSKIDNLLRTTDYDGHDALEEAYKKLLSYKEGSIDADDVDYAALILAGVTEANEAIKAYYLTQKGSEENPADFTIFIQHPWFINTEAEPVMQDGELVFPNRYDEDGNDTYSVGSASSPDLNSEGWYIAGASGGDQRLNFQQGRSCWNAWNNNFTSTLAVAQDIEGLPNGYYTISADLVTQSGCMNDQHVYGETIADKQISNSLSTEGWDVIDTNVGEWETLAMTAEQKVLVVDGKLTIGAEGTGTGSGATGWFLATNFHVYYLGEAPAEAVKEAFDKKVAAANELAATMHFKADQKALNDSIAKFAAYTDYVAAMQGLHAAMAVAKKSEALYEEYIPSDGTIEGKTIPTVGNTLKKFGGEGYGAAEDIVQYAYDYVQTWIACDTASYVYFEATVDLLKNYLNTYTPVYNEAAKVASAASEKGKKLLQSTMDSQKAALVSEMKDKETVNTFVSELNSLMAVVKKQNVFDDPDATDYTVYIQNPNLEAETGWEFTKGNGNNNTTSGQWFNGDGNVRYIDSYNSNGLQGFIATQLVKDLPNGTYTVGVYTRTPAEGAYILNAVSADTTFVEIPMNYHNTYTEAGEDTVVVASDQFGPIWEDARVKVEDEGISPTDPTYDEITNIYNANNGNGRGWQHQEMAGIVVTNHELLIGTMAGNELSKAGKVFGGNWYSVGGWTLKLTAKGDNSGWGGPIAASITDVKSATAAADGIYTIAGARVANLQRGLNIVVSNGKVRKVLVK